MLNYAWMDSLLSSYKQLDMVAIFSFLVVVFQVMVVIPGMARVVSALFCK